MLHAHIYRLNVEIHKYLSIILFTFKVLSSIHPKSHMMNSRSLLEAPNVNQCPKSRSWARDNFSYYTKMFDKFSYSNIHVICEIYF